MREVSDVVHALGIRHKSVARGEDALLRQATRPSVEQSKLRSALRQSTFKLIGGRCGARPSDGGAAAGAASGRASIACGALRSGRSSLGGAARSSLSGFPLPSKPRVSSPAAPQRPAGAQAAGGRVPAAAGRAPASDEVSLDMSLPRLSGLEAEEDEAAG
eukprot:5493547-Prymnesium_polylepis.1